MSKKKITAPLTYNPGKGRPKEYLAYLNYQEMQALKRLNGEGPYKGPKGLPSFVLGGAKTSGTAANSAMKSASQSSGSRPSSGGRDSGIRDSVGANRPSSSGASRGDVGGRDSGTRDSVGANRPSASGASRGDVGGRDGGIRNVAGASTPDKSAISSANRTNTVSAQKSPAFKADTGRTVNVGPMGTPVKIGAEVKRPTVPKATVASPMATQGTSFASPLDARIENFQRINDARFKAGALGPEGVPSVSQIAADNARRLNAVKMAQQYSQYRSPPTGYPVAPQGVYGPRAGVDTRYLGTKDMPGMITTGMTSPYSGAVDPRFSAASTLRAYEAAKRVPGKIQDRVPSGVVPRVSPEERYIMNRPDVAQGAPLRRDRFGEPILSKKETYDRVLPESEYSEYGSFGPPSAPGKTRGIGDVAPSYPNYGPPSGNRGLGGLNPATSKVNGYDVYNPADYENSLAIQTPSWRQSPAYSYSPEDEDQSSVNPSQGPAAPSQDITISEEAELAQEEARKRAGQARKGTQTALNFVAAPLGTVVGEGLKALDARTQKLVDDYQVAGMPERKVMEEKNPNLIARANEMGINSYYGMDKYNSWAEKSGLRAPPSREGGGENSGIRSLTREPEGDETTTPTPDTPSTPSGRRPDIYYMWDLGVNVPSPSDPNYTQYQTYLAERLAAQRAMGYV